MGISVEATETKATALLTECRRCLSIGVELEARFIKDLIAQLELFTTTDTSGRTDKTPSNADDGRSTAEVAVIT